MHTSTVSYKPVHIVQYLMCSHHQIEERVCIFAYPLVTTMVHSIFEGCSDSCGWIAAFIATLSFGSYGMTIKECSKKNVDADPLVLQARHFNQLLDVPVNFKLYFVLIFPSSPQSHTKLLSSS
jgi:hypothetical protein